MKSALISIGFIVLALIILASMFFPVFPIETAGLIVFLPGDAVWILLLCAGVGRALLTSWPLVVRKSIAVAGILALGAHFDGYKLFGSATVHDNRPVLDSPRQLAAVAAPNVLVAADGTRFEVRGVTFTPELLARSTENLQRLFSGEPEPVLIQADAASPSGVVFQARYNYFCGNTFFPTILPPRLPAYGREDIGQYLTGFRLATTSATQE